jgi:ribosome maturation factor RimP
VYPDIPEELLTLIEPIVADHGLELVDVERHQARPPWTLRVIVDTTCGDGLVSIERCAEVSREIGARLDAADTVPVAYQLEVSSPGFDRVLAREKDFARALGQEIRLETRTPRDGRRRFRGRLLAFDAGVARVSVEGSEFAIPFEDVAKARAVYAFTRDDFARTGGSGR